MKNEVQIDQVIARYMHDKSGDEIEKAVIHALFHAGTTTKGRPWYTPCGALVKALGWAARTANDMDIAQGALMAALAYGILDIFGFKGTLDLVVKIVKKGGKTDADTGSQNGSVS